MLEDSVGFLLIFVATLLMAIPLGKYMTTVYKDDRSFLDFLKPVESRIFQVCGIDSKVSMNWKKIPFGPGYHPGSLAPVRLFCFSAAGAVVS